MVERNWKEERGEGSGRGGKAGQPAPHQRLACKNAGQIGPLRKVIKG